VAGGSGWWGVEQRAGGDDPEQARFVELDGDEEIVGYGCVWRRQGTVFGLDALVDPEVRGRGVGRKLMDRLFEELAARRATAVEARVDANHPEALSFLVRRGFFELNRLERVRLDLERADLGTFDPVPEGIEIGTLAGSRDGEGRRAIPALLDSAFADQPNHPNRQPFSEMALEQLRSDLERSLAEASFIARQRGEMVGFTGLMPGPDPRTLTAYMTAVRPDQRRRNVALALKQRANHAAKRLGYRAIVSNSLNLAMQELNERLGFVRYAPPEIRMGRRL
jgi:GNAT superfamily N-acetyltransferase